MDFSHETQRPRFGRRKRKEDGGAKVKSNGPHDLFLGTGVSLGITQRYSSLLGGYRKGTLHCWDIKQQAQGGFVLGGGGGGEVLTYHGVCDSLA